jgi:hypothetical protein
MLQHFKLILFTAAVASAGFSQSGTFGYGAALQMAAAVLQALLRLMRRAPGHGGDRTALRRLRGHSVQHV